MSQARDNLITLYEDAEEPLLVAAREFYPLELDMVSGIAQEFHRPLENTVWAYAALSPQQTWTQNIRALKRLMSDHRFVNPGHLARESHRAWAALHGEFDVVQGMKVRSFAKAILGDLRAVAIDRWVLRGVGHRNDSCSNRQYKQYEMEIRAVADIKGEEPRALQAVVWLGLREPTRRLL